MQKLKKEIQKLKNSKIKKDVEQRLKEFESFKKKSDKEWFSELCYCILTANSKGKTACKIQETLGYKGFSGHDFEKLSKCIRSHGHRFHNNKSKYIIGARKNKKIKLKLDKMSEEEAREWLVANIKGLGYKEASHFMRNVGFKNFAILDRHVLNIMKFYDFIDEKPKTLTKKKYFEIEKKFNSIAKKLGMSPAELDLYMWSMKTGEVLK